MGMYCLVSWLVLYSVAPPDDRTFLQSAWPLWSMQASHASHLLQASHLSKMGQLFKDNKNCLFGDLVPMNSSSQVLRLVKASTTNTTTTTNAIRTINIKVVGSQPVQSNLWTLQLALSANARNNKVTKTVPTGSADGKFMFKYFEPLISTDSRSRPEAKLIIRSSAKRVWEKKWGWCGGWTPTRSKPRRQIVRHPRGTVSPLSRWWWNSCIARPSPLRGVSVPAWREPFLLAVLLQLQPYLILSWPAFSCCIDQGVCMSSSPYLIQKQSLSFTEFVTEAGFFLFNSH